MEKDLKDYREKELKTFLFGNVLLVLLGTGFIQNIVEPLGADNVWKALAELFGSSVCLTIIYIFAFVLDSIIPGRIKERIIWPVCGLPGRRIFTDIRDKNRDDRFILEDALQAYEKVYKEIDKNNDKEQCGNIQNAAWYKIYQKYETHAQVYVSHRDFLLCRDMATLVVWVFVGTLLLYGYTGKDISSKLIIFMVVEFIILWIAAKVKGKSFVYNVIAKDLAIYSKENQQSKILL